MSINVASRIGVAGWQNITTSIVQRVTTYDGTTVTVDMSGVMVGDFAVISLSVNANPGVTTPTGWNLVYSTTSSFTGKQTAAFWKKIDGTEPEELDIEFTSTPSSPDVLFVAIRNASQLESIVSAYDASDPATWASAPVSEGGAIDLLIATVSPTTTATWSSPSGYNALLPQNAPTRSNAWTSKLPPANEATAINTIPDSFSAQIVLRAIFSVEIPQTGGGPTNAATIVRPYFGALTFNNMPLADTIQTTFPFDSSSMSEVRIAAATTGDNVSGTIYLATLGELDPMGDIQTIPSAAVSFASDSAQDSGWVSLPASAIGSDKVFAVVTEGGNGGSDPEIVDDTFVVEFRP